MRVKSLVIFVVGLLCGILVSPITIWLLMSPPDLHSAVPVQRSGRSSPDSLLLDTPVVDRELLQDGDMDKLEPVGVSVLSDSKTLHTRASAAYHSYGKGLNNNFNIYTIPTGIPSGRKRWKQLQEALHIRYMKRLENTNHTKTHFIHLLDHLCQTKSYTNYHFMLLLRDDSYVQVQNLLKFVHSLLTTSTTPYYIGSQSENGAHCKLDSGILLHRTAFQKMCPHFPLYCSNVIKQASVLTEEEIMGKCLLNALGETCWSPSNEQAKLLFYHGHQNTKRRPHNDVLQNAITIFPVSDSEHFISIHRSVTETQVNLLLKNAGSIVNDLVMMDNSVFTTSIQPSYNWKWLWYKSRNINPRSRHELMVWQYSDSSSVYQPHEHLPSLPLLMRHKSSMNSALEVVIQNLNISGKFKGHPIVLNEGYFAVDESSGIEYILNITVKMKSHVNYLSNVIIPFGGPGMSINHRIDDLITPTITVNLIVPVAHYHNLVPFLEMYENICVKTNELTYLHLVFFSHDEIISRKILQIKEIYPLAQIQIHEITGRSYSASYAYNHIAEKLTDSELMVFFDPNFRFTSKFLSHCRMNTIRKKQIFSPILFSFYKPELINSQDLHSKDSELRITSDTGFFLRYNYQVMSIYRSDYVKVGGYKHPKGTKDSDEVLLVENILKSEFYLMRALEPFLTKPFQLRNCKGLKAGHIQESCMKSVADSIGSKKSLGSYLLNKGLL